jgi:hypothetical protein
VQTHFLNNLTKDRKFFYAEICCYLMLCPSILYNFWLPFWYLQTFLNLKTCTYVFMAIFYQGCKIMLNSLWKKIHVNFLKGLCFYKWPGKKVQFQFLLQKQMYVFMAIFYRGCKYGHWLIHNPNQFVFKSIPQPQVTVYLTF